MGGSCIIFVRFREDDGGGWTNSPSLTEDGDEIGLPAAIERAL